MRKILAFDSWTGGIYNYARLVPALKAAGFELTLVHLGSWGVDADRPKEETLQEVRVRDISYYADRGFDSVLDAEEPSAVLFLSTQTFAHRAMIRFCRAKGIPTIHLTHGIFATIPVETGRYYSYNVMSYAKMVLSRLKKMATLVWPVYLRSLLKTRATWRDYRYFVRDNLNLLLGKDAPFADDTITDLCLIYADADRGYAEQNFRFPADKVIVVGNPDLARFGLTDDMIGSFRAADMGKRPDVMYIDTSLILRGAIFGNVSEYVEHLVELRDRIEALGKRLLVKLHPNFDTTSVPALLKERGVRLCDHHEFVAGLSSSCCVITEASTAALVPAYMGMPLLLAKFGRLAAHEFGRIFKEYPRAQHLTDLARLAEVFSDADLLGGGTDARVREWIESNIGPKPVSHMPDRVVQAIASLVEEAKKAGRAHELG